MMYATTTITRTTNRWVTVHVTNTFSEETGTAYLGAHRHIQYSRSTYTEPYPTREMMRDKGPQWGWWAAFYPPHPERLPSLEIRADRPPRGQSRACATDQRRWKRRRFLHQLRSV